MVPLPARSSAVLLRAAGGPRGSADGTAGDSRLSRGPHTPVQWPCHGQGCNGFWGSPARRTSREWAGDEFSARGVAGCRIQGDKIHYKQTKKKGKQLGMSGNGIKTKGLVLGRVNLGEMSCAGCWSSCLWGQLIREGSCLMGSDGVNFFTGPVAPPTYEGPVGSPTFNPPPAAGEETPANSLNPSSPAPAPCCPVSPLPIATPQLVLPPMLASAAATAAADPSVHPLTPSTHPKFLLSRGSFAC